MKEKYLVKGSKKETFFGEYEDYEEEVSKEKLVALLNDPKVLIDEVLRRNSSAEDEDKIPVQSLCGGIEATIKQREEYSLSDIPDGDYTYKDEDGTWMVQPHRDGWIIEPHAMYLQPDEDVK